MRRHTTVLLAVCVVAVVSVLGACAASPVMAAGGQANFSLTQGNFGLYPQTPPGGTALEEIFKNTTIVVAGGQATASTNVSISFMYRDTPCTGTAYLTFTGAFTDAMSLLTGTYSFGYDIVYGGGWMGSQRQVAAYTGAVETGVGPNDVTGKDVIPFVGDWTITDYTPAPGGGWEVFGTSSGSDTVRVTFSIVGTVPGRDTTILEGFKGTGKVRISRDGGETWSEAKPGDEVGVDNLVSVENVPGTRARIVYRDGSFFTMRPGTVVRTLSGGLQVQQGEVWINLKKQGETFEVVTPTSVCGVLGTEFMVTVVPGVKDEIVLFSGQVKVTGPGGEAAVLTPGQQVTTTVAGLGRVESSAPFTDIGGNPYATAILGMSQAGIVSGREQGGVWLFAPEENVKRAQFAKMVCGAMEIPVTEGSWLDPARPFPDLEPDKSDDLYPHRLHRRRVLSRDRQGRRAGRLQPLRQHLPGGSRPDGGTCAREPVACCSGPGPHRIRFQRTGTVRGTR